MHQTFWYIYLNICIHDKLSNHLNIHMIIYIFRKYASPYKITLLSWLRTQAFVVYMLLVGVCGREHPLQAIYGSGAKDTDVRTNCGHSRSNLCWQLKSCSQRQAAHHDPSSDASDWARDYWTVGVMASRMYSAGDSTVRRNIAAVGCAAQNWHSWMAPDSITKVHALAAWQYKWHQKQKSINSYNTHLQGIQVYSTAQHPFAH